MLVMVVGTVLLGACIGLFAIGDATADSATDCWGAMIYCRCH
jgi:hypothetical protein